MKRVTAIGEGKRRKRRVNIFLDDKFAFSLEAGMSTKSCRAVTALRIRVSMSAIGSVIMARCYQLDFLTPGIWPSRASLRKQMRQRLNFRR